ncbi:hypothetical protein KUH03_17950 [Sphingobacterium sp. E70]|uniref:hypothetical protein n=1 Tax=Sphingobacterium sp. E70 TaxID=2853439 RepID=UPI00211C07F7|nr:hypothetical protein [Sphingobacterium sp. E70]ULT28302.1 hypothetical protein KUH03_17950 [Sphingobacterium sp. E70]
MNIVPLKQVGRWAAIALIGLTVLSCKKDNPKPEPEPEPTDRTEGQLIKDDIYKYYKLYSVWADGSIPDYLKIRLSIPINMVRQVMCLMHSKG